MFVNKPPAAFELDFSEPPFKPAGGEHEILKTGFQGSISLSKTGTGGTFH